MKSQGPSGGFCYNSFQERQAIMHFGEISIVAGRANKKAGSYMHDVYLAAAWMLQQGIRGNKTTWGNSIHISQIMW